MQASRPVVFLAVAFLLGSTACSRLRPDPAPVSIDKPLAVTPTSISSSTDWHLVFHDEFDETGLNSVWSTELPWGPTSPPELEYYIPDAFEFNDGILRIKAQKQSFQGKDYTSGVISSYPQFSFTYGYAEIRAKLPSGEGLWPAFWLLASDQKSSHEIDVFELIGNDPNTIYMTLHYDTPSGSQHVQGSYNGPDFSQGFHIYAVDWEPSEIVWFVDGMERYRVSQNIPQSPMNIITNLAVGGDWPGTPNPSTQFPAYFDIDYLRVYQHN